MLPRLTPKGFLTWIENPCTSVTRALLWPCRESNLDAAVSRRVIISNSQLSPEGVSSTPPSRLKGGIKKDNNRDTPVRAN